MELNNMNIDPRLLADLYQGVLVTEQQGFRWLGGRAKPVLVLVNQTAAPFLTDEDLPFLTRLLNACKLTFEDVAIFNTASYSTAQPDEVLAFFSPRMALCFGVTPNEWGLPVDFPRYQLQALKGCTFMHAPTLQQLASDTEERKQCWASLKRLFNL
ncbi:MAG: hypothetical protein ACKOD1_00930 [Sphingomonadales bacterium]